MRLFQTERDLRVQHDLRSPQREALRRLWPEGRPAVGRGRGGGRKQKCGHVSGGLNIPYRICQISSLLYMNTVRKKMFALGCVTCPRAQRRVMQPRKSLISGPCTSTWMKQERDRLRHNLTTGDAIGIGYWFTNSTSEESLADCYLWLERLFVFTKLSRILSNEICYFLIFLGAHLMGRHLRAKKLQPARATHWMKESF